LVFALRLAQGGELVEPFEIYILVLEIFMISIKRENLFIPGNYLFK
jgi:hypothetical protein